MSDQFTEVTTEGWLQRLGGSLIAALIGFILVPASIVLLYWNEGRAVSAIRALDRGASAIVEISPEPVDPQANGKLVHVSGMMQPGTSARDPLFGVTGDGVLRLSRSVEMYQWQQESHSESQQSVGGSKTTVTTYTYKHVWSDQPIVSANFKVRGGHENPPMDPRSATFDGTGVKLGAYRVDPSLLNKVAAFTPLHAQAPPPSGYQGSGDGYYRGPDPNQPAIGDLRVSFAAVPAQTISVVAANAGGVLTGYRDSNGYTIALAEPGAVTASGLFHDELKSAGRLTWILRGVGFVAMLIGFICMTRPLTMLFAVLPFLESLVGAGAFLVAITLAVPITLLTISVAWIAHRPLIGGGLLVASVVAWLLLRQVLPRRQVVRV
ncbi:TMEM43 family protein [Acidisphaera sp. S103]|uniref:TMEM43 family protein n=1 Tax=Acidisphaera sp. S103 TaxID=1747223 RepID=UPI00131AC6A3|nr:TMEM43 family protein [Acidisphaera sp. S103]